MSGRRVGIYYAWSRSDEAAIDLSTLDNRFTALFEARRLQWPRLEAFADPVRFDQGIDGFIEHVLLWNYDEFLRLCEQSTGQPVKAMQRRMGDAFLPIERTWLAELDTLIVISWDSRRTEQKAQTEEIEAVRDFLGDPRHTVFVSPHHDIGDVDGLPEQHRFARKEIEFHHHGDLGVPSQQRYGEFAITLLDGLGLQVRNRYGLRPARKSDGTPANIEISKGLDRFDLLSGVPTFNLHPHLPHFETIGETAENFDVLARQLIDVDAPPHPFRESGRQVFDALLQTKATTFPGRLLVCDSTLWTTLSGGLDSLRRFWRNIIELPLA